MGKHEEEGNNPDRIDGETLGRHWRKKRGHGMSPIRMEKAESSIRLVLEFHEAFNRQDVEGMMRLVSDSCVYESAEAAPEGRRLTGKEATAQYWGQYFRASPGVRREIEEIVGLGMRCVVRWRETGLGEEAGRVRGVDLFLVKEGAISEQYSYVKR
jgi:ketosteroid isomerase-like protein